MRMNRRISCKVHPHGIWQQRLGALGFPNGQTTNQTPAWDQKPAVGHPEHGYGLLLRVQSFCLEDVARPSSVSV